MANLYILSGCPGSGKSTWVKNHINPYFDKYVSRDDIRFSLVKEGEEYFSKEKEVFKLFVHQINQYLLEEKNVFADATHLNRASRNKLLRNICGNPHINVIWMKTSLEECLKRNENRKGTRSYVPREVIKNMYFNLERPSFEEGIEKIYIVDANGKLHLKVRVE